MTTICKPIDAIAKFVYKTKLQPDTAYRLSDQCVMQDTEDGVLLYHTLTGAVLLLEPAESALLAHLPGAVPEALAELVPARFLVPVDTDEMTYCNQILRLCNLTRKKSDAIFAYEIFTTSDCNARCFYCFERNAKRITMTEATARAAGEFIVSHCKDKPVLLTWFGGEPLFNSAAIDTIVQILREKNIPYSSKMVSNGYLFDKELVKKATDLWKLKKIQITLDGTEEIYNRRKAYIYREGSAYRRVLRNIGLLLDAGIYVIIRLNLDCGNQNDLFDLIKELSETFGARNTLTVYCNILFEILEGEQFAEKRKALYHVSQELTDYINQCGYGKHSGVSRAVRTNACEADNDSCATIMPDGRLGKCEFYPESEAYGSLFSDEKDMAMIESWKEPSPVFPSCKTCFYYPMCFRPKKCPHRKSFCDPEAREQRKRTLQQKMLNSWKEYRSSASAEDEQDNFEC